MSGKAYTMKEMKAIVEYLTEHRAYGEIKGRKMWMDFANSNLTTRTWQSLKETFLKRILPDIANPYYKLTVQQIASFKQGSDIEAKLNNKLEIRTADEDSNSHDVQDNDPQIIRNPQTSNPENDNEVNEPGEDPQPSKINQSRSSTDTVVIEQCYNTAEEIQKELESPVQKGKYEDVAPKVAQKKSLRDYITYSEPLTPILQEVLHDFETDEEDGSDKEPQMQIVEYPEPNIPNDNSTANEINNTENNDCDGDKKKEENQNNNINKDTLPETQNQKTTKDDNNIITIEDNTDTIECIDIPDDSPTNNSDDNVNEISEKNDVNTDLAHSSVEPNADVQVQKDAVDQQEDSGNQSIPPTNTLPNNQEAYKELCDTRQNARNEEHSESSSVDKHLKETKKRAKSQEINCGILRKRLRLRRDLQSSSDVDGKAEKIKKINTKLWKKKSNPKENEKQKKNKDDVESHQDLPLIIENTVNTDSVSLSNDIIINKQPTTEANTSMNMEQEATSTSNAEQNPALIDKADTSGTTKSIQEAEKEEDMPQNRKRKTENDITPNSNERQKSAMHDKDDSSSKTKYKQVSKEGKVVADNYIREIMNEVVILKSQSDSASDHDATTPKKNKATRHSQHKVHRDKALANVFGFSSGFSTSRKKTMKHRKRIPSYRMDYTSDSDEWTSESESEYVSPPRGRKNRQTRKYLKPKSAKILSLEEEGGLFVVYGKKIYPLVKDGKIIKNYTTFSPGKDSEDEESFWKLKYVEEKKKTEELTKLLKENKKSPRMSTESEVPMAFSRGKSSTPLNFPKENDAVTNKEIVQRQSMSKDTEKIKQEGEQKTVKIKYTKNNEEVQLEGHWSQVHPVLEHLVHILHKDQEQTKDKSGEIEKTTAENENTTTAKKSIAAKGKTETEEVKPVTKKVKSTAGKSRTAEKDVTEMQQDGGAKKLPDENKKTSRNSTPVSLILLEDDVQEKISKIEDEIFREIEEREKADSILENSTITNVTQRKGARTRKTSSVVDQASPSKKSKVSNNSDKTPAKNQSLQEENKNIPAEETRPTRTSKKGVNDKVDKEEKTANIEKRVTRRSLQDAQNKYNLRVSPTTKQPAKVNTKQKPRKRYTVQPARIISSPDNISNDSAESSLGYQDSDISNISMCLRRKRKLSLTVLNKGRAKSQRTSRKFQSCASEFSSDTSSLSFITAPIKQSSHQNSSLNTDVYGSESYQMLFPKKQNSQKHLNLDTIEELNAPLDKTYSVSCINNNYDTPNLRIEKSQNSNDLSPSGNYEDNSSQITLPPSPVLSIVEKISVNKNVLSSSNDMPVDITIDEFNRTGLNDNIVLDVDMTAPSMEQSLQKSNQNEKECNFNINVAEPSQKISDSFLSKVDAVNLKEPSLSESIHQKLKNLLLESAKKIAQHVNKSHNKGVINKMEICEPETQRKTKGRKRCSTPRKRQKRQNTNVDNAEQLILEHTESCGNKKSFPTPLLVVTDASDFQQMGGNTEINTAKNDKTKTGRKKDVIKVKISKPKTKNKGKILDDAIEKEVKSSLQTDSGINDTESGVFLQGCEDTVDLIHNHSDTCLHAHECVGNSVEIIDENAVSVITLNSQSPLVKELKTSKSLNYVNDNALMDIFCEDAQDAVNVFKAIKKQKETTYEAGANLNISDTNVSSLNSLLTDDLSDETVTPTPPNKQISKWYLLSEEETSNTNCLNIALHSNSNSGCGSNLQEIFPIICAVPDLSTITEEHTPKVNTVD